MKSIKGVTVCSVCGKPWSKGLSGAATDVASGGMRHFPNCPGEKK